MIPMILRRATAIQRNRTRVIRREKLLFVASAMTRCSLGIHPPLLDADTCRIDGAGEQSGVLRAWMPSGRDEPQPLGYLWLEVAKGDAQLNDLRSHAGSLKRAAKAVGDARQEVEIGRASCRERV